MTVADLMIPSANLKPIHPQTPLPEVISTLTQGAIGSSWVENPAVPGHLMGLITDGDLRRALRDHGSERWPSLTAEELMTPDPITIHEDLLAVEAIQRMEHNRRKPISVLPVVDASGQLSGLLRLHDLVPAGLA